jgi:hypothetical protein
MLGIMEKKVDMFDYRDVEAYLRALDEQLGLQGHYIELVVCGGTLLEWMEYGDVVRRIS